MFSVITTASSITMPIAIAIAPSVMRLNVWPTSDMTKTVIAIVSGIDDALIAVMRACRRKMSSTITASTAPMSIASRTDLTASRTSAAWSYTGLRLTPGGSVLRTIAAMRATLSAIAQRVAADLPRDVDQRGGLSVAGDDPHVVLGPGATVARSRTRRPRATTMFAISSAECASRR